MTFFLQIHRFHKRYTAQLSAILAPHELSNANWSLLHYLMEHGLTTTSQIAKYWDVEKPTVSANVKTLTRHGLIQIKYGEDKREKYLSLTESGENLYGIIFPEIKLLQQRLLSTMTEAQRQKFQQALNEMEQLLKEGLL